MQWCLFSLLVLPILSSATFVDVVNTTEEINELFLDPDLGEQVPAVSANDSMLTDEAFLQPPPELANRHDKPPPFTFGSDKLRWQTWRGFLPKGVVHIYNGYTRRYDYVCKYRCEAGFYNPRMGPYCNYPFARKAYRCAPFEVLVNEDNFEVLEWKPSSFGSVPMNSAGTCFTGDKFVGKNRFGLGKVHPRHRAFFLPWKRREYWYRKRYQVLTVNKSVYTERISDIKYQTDSASIIHGPPETFGISTITNNACRAVVKTVSISKSTSVEHRWDHSYSVTASATRSIQVSIPRIIRGEIQFSTEKTMEFSNGKSVTEERSHSVSVELSVPPNHSCKARMVGYQYKLDIPYTARLTRTFQNGQVRSTVIKGVYHGVLIDEVQAETDRCRPVGYYAPCP